MPFEYETEDRRITFMEAFGYYDVQIETAFIGCTNGQIIRMYRWVSDNEKNTPVANSNFVFAATTNHTYYSDGAWDWNIPHELIKEYPYDTEDCVPDDYKPLYMLKDSRRSWWYPNDPEGQLLTQHLTNAIHLLRMERNWTNYYHLVRDGFSSTSQRIKEDVEWDLRFLIRSSPTDELNFMNNDPLFPPSLKSYLEQEIEKRAQQ